MPRPKGLAKTGGRKVGSHNKPLASVLARLAQLKCDPVRGLVTIAAEALAGGNGELAAYCYSRLLPYVYPRLGILDVKVTDDTGTARRLEAALERMRATLAQPPPRPAQSIGHAPPPSVIDMPADSAGRAVAPPEPRSAIIRQSEPLKAHVAAPGESGGPILPPLRQVPVFPGWAGMRDADAPWQPSGPAGLSPARTGDGRMVYLGMLTRDPTERDSEE